MIAARIERLMKTSSHRDRRLAWAGAAMVGMLTIAGCAAEPSTEEESLPVVATQLNWVTNVEFAGMWIAESEGYYAEEGIVAEWLPGGPNVSNTVQIVASGDAPIGLDTNFTSFIDAVSEGADVVLVGAVYQESPLAIMSLSENPINSVEDMIGKRIGSPQGQQRELDAIFTINGLEPDYEFVPIGYDVQALVNGDVDGITAFATNQGLILEEQGVDYTSVSWQDLGLDVYSNMIFVDRTYLEENRDLVVAWLRATVKGWEKNADDPEVAAQLAVDVWGADLGLSLSQQIKENINQIPMTTSDLTAESGLLRISAEDIEQKMYPILRAAGMTDLPDVATYVDESLLDEVFGGSATLLR